MSAGNYTLTVSQASTQAVTQQGYRGGRGQAAPMFQQLQMALAITDTDLSGVNVALTAANTGSQ